MKNEKLFKVAYVRKELKGEAEDIDKGMESFETLWSPRIYREKVLMIF